MDLKSQQCEPCHNDAPAMTPDEYNAHLEALQGWDIRSIEGADCLVKNYSFPDFKQAMDFAVAVGEIAEEVGHHPLIELTWGKVTLSWWTHNINGLHINDFIMAARSDDLLSS